MRLSQLQVTRSTVSACAIPPKTEGARSWSRDGHARVALWWKMHMGAQVLCTAHRQPVPTEHPWDTQNLPVSLVECLQVAQLLPGGPCCVPRAWVTVVFQLLPHRTAPSCELRLSFHLWLSFHLSPDSGDQLGQPCSPHRLLVQNRTVGTQALRLPCCSCAITAKPCIHL